MPFVALATACEILAPLGREPFDIPRSVVTAGESGADAQSGAEPTCSACEAGEGGRGGAKSDAGDNGVGSGGAGAGGVGGRAGEGGGNMGNSAGNGGFAGGSGGSAAGAAGGLVVGAGARPSCEGLDQVCGPEGMDCCTSTRLPSGVFSLGGEKRLENSTAVLDSFELDVFEVTVGRFRMFLDAYEAWRAAGNPKPGAGTLPHMDNGTGWQPAWDEKLPADKATFEQNLLHCPGDRPSYASSAEALARPINCMSWEEAFAFCLWDDARLPTNAEYEYATFGGDEYRRYPWGSTPLSGEYAIYGCVAAGGTPDNCGIEGLAPAGSRPYGAGRWGQRDLLGSVAEYVLDYYGYYPENCVGCAITSGQYRVFRGGAWWFPPDYVSSTRVDYFADDTTRYSSQGVRCARTIQ
jgi:formylglycine-generating enzyme required for sulfatase activity